MYFSNDKIVRKNFFVASIIALPFGRWQPLLGAVSFFSDNHPSKCSKQLGKRRVPFKAFGGAEVSDVPGLREPLVNYVNIAKKATSNCSCPMPWQNSVNTIKRP